jgi:hypothetical protein
MMLAKSSATARHLPTTLTPNPRLSGRDSARMIRLSAKKPCTEGREI